MNKIFTIFLLYEQILEILDSQSQYKGNAVIACFSASDFSIISVTFCQILELDAPKHPRLLQLNFEQL